MFCEIPVSSVPAFSMVAPEKSSMKSEKSLVCVLPRSYGLLEKMDAIFDGMKLYSELSLEK